jgi:hypothetical protein
MTFGPRDYVPVLKVKRGEKGALRSLGNGVVQHITPMLEIVERRGPQLKAHVETAFSNLAESVSRFPRCFLDARALAPDGEAAARIVFERASSESIAFSPVTGPARTADVAAALAHRRHGLALRLTRAELEGGTLRVELEAFMVRHSLEREEIDIILDLGAVDDMVTEGISALAAAFLAEVGDHAHWRTLTISASAFPMSMRIVDRNSYEMVERAEWASWRHSLHDRRRDLGRLPTFSDCCIQHPRGVEGFDPKTMQVSASIRYTWRDSWLLIKGESTRKTLPSIQFPTLAAQLVRGVHRTHFYGSDHCEGCRLIQASADNEPGLGSAEAWRRLGTIHHITTVAEHIAGLPWP